MTKFQHSLESVFSGRKQGHFATSKQDGWRRPRARAMCLWRDSNMAWRNWVSWWNMWKRKAVCGCLRLSGSCFGGDWGCFQRWSGEVSDPGIWGFDLEGAELKKWTDQLLSKTGAGKEVIMRRRHCFRWKVKIGPKNGLVSHGFASKDHRIYTAHFL